MAVAARTPCLFYIDQYFVTYDLKDTRRKDPSDLIVNGEYVNDQGQRLRGSFVNNICQNAQVASQCQNQPPSLFYFVSSEGVCISLIRNDKSVPINVINKEKPEDGVVLAPKDSNFIVYVQCDPNEPYSVQSTKFVDSKTVAFYLRSKFSCGSINGPAEALDTNKYIFSLALMAFGLFLLVYGGISFQRFLTIILITLVSLLVLFTILYLFDFRLNSYAVGVITSISLAVGIIIRWLNKLYKWIENVVIGYFGATFGIQVAGTLDPNGYLYQKALIGFIVFLMIKAIVIILVIIYRDFLILVINSFVGAGLFVYNLGYICGYLPNFFALADEVSKFGDEAPMIYKVHVGLMCLLALLSIVIQLYRKHYVIPQQERRGYDVYKNHI